VADVTTARHQADATESDGKLSAGDEQLIRELTRRARENGSPYLTGVPRVPRGTRPCPACPDRCPGYGALATVRDRRRGRLRRPRRAARVVAMRTRRAWFSGFANPRAVRATILAVRLCASAFAFE
jgi:hypothetical protein